MLRIRTKLQNDLDETLRQRDQTRQELSQIRRELQLSTEHCETLKVGTPLDQFQFSNCLSPLSLNSLQHWWRVIAVSRR